MLLKFAQLLKRAVIFTALTLLTQIGGIVYILAKLTFTLLPKKAKQKRPTLKKYSVYLSTYLLATFLIVPAIAPIFGRVALPVFKQNNLAPLSFATCLLNRHYVVNSLKEISLNVATNFDNSENSQSLYYLDANFPFWDGFPLLPHLSHNDGKKIDFALIYEQNGAPSPIGYGISEEALQGEIDYSKKCNKYWQYSILKKIIPQWNKKNYTFSTSKTAYLIKQFAKQPQVSKIFIEPHLKQRLSLTSPKVRFAGCHAVRHDDHIHVEIK